MKDSPDSQWANPPECPEARRDEIHVWRASLEDSASWAQSLGHLLSADERERAHRFLFERDRPNFISSRAFLRLLTGRYLHMEPSRLEFGYSSKGKPFVVGARDVDLRFNLSHSHGMALYAFTCGREVGIDLEHISETIETDDIAGHFFSPTEVGALRALPRELQRWGFFACWTRKEAYIKALGDGLSVPLASFSVSLIPGESTVLLDVETDPEESSCWSLTELCPDSSYAAALAVEGWNWRLRCWELTADAAHAFTQLSGVGSS